MKRFSLKNIKKNLNRVLSAETREREMTRLSDFVEQTGEKIEQKVETVRNQNGKGHLGRTLADQPRTPINGSLHTSLVYGSNAVVKGATDLIDYATVAVEKRRENKKLIRILSRPAPGPILLVDAKGGAITAPKTFAIGKARRQQIEEIYTEEDKQRMHAARKQFNRNIRLAGYSLGLSTAGLFYAPITLASVPILIYLGIPIYVKTYKMLKKGKVGIESLTAVVLAGCLAGGFIWVASIAIYLRLLSRRFLASVTEDSRHKLIDVFRQYPKFAWVIADGVEVQIPIEEVKAGQAVVVNAGETIPVDGIITDGLATVDQHILTGESKPVEKELGDPVFALTIVLSGRIVVTVEKAGQETTVAQIGEILNNTTEFKANAELRAETLADKTVLPTLAIAGIALPTVGPIGALAVINAHFKHKMSAVAPLSLMNYLNIASQRGILIKDGRSLDLLSRVDTLVFDKTGTLTQEQPHVGAVHTCGSYDENTLLTLAAAAEQRQTHPIAKAILDEAKKRQLPLYGIDDAQYKVGYGLTVSFDSKMVRVGSSRFMEVSNLEIPPELKSVQEHCHQQGHSLVMVAIEDEVAGGIELLPTVRPEAKAVIAELARRKQIKSMYIISGDHEIPTKKLAEELGIDHYFAETLPEDKANLIERLKAEGRFICYVGDGINDSIALKASHVSVSLRGASSLAVDTAQIILMDEHLSHLVSLFDFAQAFQTNTNISFGIVIIPTLVGIGGAFLLHFGLAHTIVLNLVSLGAGIANGMMPALKNRLKPHEGVTQASNLVEQEP
jgi:heavy metal translocating P-type ATPase